MLEWTCPGYSGGEMWSWGGRRGPRVSARSMQQWLHHPNGHPRLPHPIGRVERQGWARGDERLGLAEPVLETVDLRPEHAIDPSGAGTPVPRCTDIAAGATYTNRFGTPKLSATVPVGAEGYWQGYRDDFIVGNCRFEDLIRIDASTVGAVINDACDPWTSTYWWSSGRWRRPRMRSSPSRATGPPNRSRSRSPATPRSASRSAEGSPCRDGIGLWYGNEFGLDRDAIVYLVDMDGDTLAIAVWYVQSQTMPPSSPRPRRSSPRSRSSDTTRSRRSPFTRGVLSAYRSDVDPEMPRSGGSPPRRRGDRPVSDPAFSVLREGEEQKALDVLVTAFTGDPVHSLDVSRCDRLLDSLSGLPSCVRWQGIHVQDGVAVSASSRPWPCGSPRTSNPTATP